MGIAEELRQYFLEAEKHREEQRQQPKLDVEQAPGGYVNTDHDLYHNRHPSVDQWNPVRGAPGHSIRPR
ncbi:Gem-associated protein 8 [Microtus ochrogaster]|uniref:Gem-associated protein 8 n=1 Tax=Microtus ochrogaster TaxID=79684 RepID=A0A8J6FZ75_MICOH|nr:Gem-associated protein 8 [Microtus ochrogaster]